MGGNVCGLCKWNFGPKVLIISQSFLCQWSGIDGKLHYAVAFRTSCFQFYKIFLIPVVKWFSGGPPIYSCCFFQEQNRASVNCQKCVASSRPAYRITNYNGFCLDLLNRATRVWYRNCFWSRFKVYLSSALCLPGTGFSQTCPCLVQNHASFI